MLSGIIGNDIMRPGWPVPLFEWLDFGAGTTPAAALGEYYDTGAVQDSKPVHKHLSAEFYQWRVSSPAPTIWAVGPSVGTAYWFRDSASSVGKYIDDHIDAVGDGFFLPV